MKKENFKTDCKNHPYFLAIGVIAVIVIIIALFSGGEDNSQKQTTNDITHKDIDYLRNIQEYSVLVSETAFIDADIMLYTLDGSLTFEDAGELFGMSEEIYSTIEDDLNKMNVPSKYVKYHEHITNAVIYAKEASRLTKEGYLYYDIDSFDEALIKLEQATSEMDKATDILDTIA